MSDKPSDSHVWIAGNWYDLANDDDWVIDASNVAGRLGEELAAAELERFVVAETAEDSA